MVGRHGARLDEEQWDLPTRSKCGAQSVRHRRNCDGCLRATDWSSDEKNLLVFGGNPYQVDVLDIASRRRATLVNHPKYNLLYARYSPDDRWVSFTMRTDSMVLNEATGNIWMMSRPATR